MYKTLRFTLVSLLMMLCGTVFAGTITFGDLNLENGVQYSDPFDGGDFTVTFAGGGNDGKYYTTGAGIRVYGGGTMTVAAKSGNITSITVTYDGSNKPSDGDVVNVGTYNAETGEWTGEASSVVFTRPTGSGHWRVQSVTVTVSGGGDDPQPQTDVYTIAGTGDLTGTAEAWTIDDANKMTKNNEGLYVKTFNGITISADNQPQFKVVKNAGKDDETWYPEGDGSSNWVITPTYLGGDGIYDITITFNAETNEIGVSGVKTSWNTIAELNALQNNTAFTFFGEPLVVAKPTDKYVYIKDETGASLIYDASGEKTAAAEAGKTIAAPWTGKVSIYKNLFELVPDAALTVKDGDAVEVTYDEATTADVTEENVNKVVIIKGLTISEINEKNITFAIGEATIAGYNQFGIELPEVTEGKTFDVVGAIGRYNDNIQFQPITITEAAAPAAEPIIPEGTYYVMSANEGTVINAEGALDTKGTLITFAFDTATGNYTITGADYFAGKQWTIANAIEGMNGYYTIKNSDGFLAASATKTLEQIADGTADAAVWILLQKSYWEDIANSTYTVAGTKDLTGTESDWQVAEANQMALNEKTGLFEKSFTGITVTAENQPQFKVVQTNMEGVSTWYPASEEGNDHNWVITPDVAGGEGIFTITITFDPSDNKEIAVTAVKTGDIEEQPVFDENVLYSWESPEGTPIEYGGTIAYVNGDGDRLNYQNSGNYTICLNGKKANVNDETASANAGKMVITLNEALHTGDEIAITAYITKSSSAKSSAYIIFETNTTVESAYFSDEANIDATFNGSPKTVTVIVPEEADGSKTITMTRGQTGTNLFITKLQILKKEQSTTNTYTATFDNAGGWNEVYAYAWTTTGEGNEAEVTEFLGGWPGTKIEAVDGVYTVTIEAEDAPANIIFNNGNGGEGNQTEDLAFEDGKAYTYAVPAQIATFNFADPNFRENIGEAMTDTKGYIYNETFTADGVSLQIIGGSAPSRIYVDANRGQNLVTYKEYTTLTFKAPEGKAITKIEFTAAGNSNINNFTASSGAIEGMIWTGNADGVRFAQGGTSYLANAIVTLEAATEATAALPAIQYTECENIAAFNALEAGTYAKLTLTNAEVIGKSADGYSTVWVQDATGGAWIQYTSLNDRLQEGTKVSGTVYTIKRLTAGNPQLKEAEATINSELNAETLDAYTIVEGSIEEVNVAANLNKVVKISGATLEMTSATAGKLTIGETTIDVNNGTETANQALCKIADWEKDKVLENITITAILVAKSATANQLLPISIEQPELPTGIIPDGTYYVMSANEGTVINAEGALDAKGTPITFTFDAATEKYTIAGADYFADKQWTIANAIEGLNGYYTFSTMNGGGTKDFMAVSATNTLEQIEDGTADAAIWILLEKTYWEDIVNSTYTIAGTKDLTGTENDWDIAEANQMKYNEETQLFEITYKNIAVNNETQPQFKVVKTNMEGNQTWYPEGGQESNWKITTEYVGGEGLYDITITFDPSDYKEIDVSVLPIVDINITPEAGADIAAALAEAAIGKKVRDITIELAKDGEYTIGSTITVPNNLTFWGNDATVTVAETMTDPFITLDGTEAFAMKNADEASDHKYINQIDIEGVKIKGLQNALIRDNQKTMVEYVKVIWSNIEMPASNKNVFDFNGKGYAGKVTVINSTIWAAGMNTGFFAQYGSRPKNVNEAWLQEFDVENSTFVNIANGKNICDLKQNGTAQNVYTLKNNIFVDCGKSGQTVVGFNKGQASPTPQWIVEGNYFEAGGECKNAAEIEKAGQHTVGEESVDIVQSCVDGKLTFTDAANGDFNGEFQLAEGATYPEATIGSPAWNITFKEYVAPATIDKLYVMGNGTAGEWNTTTEMTFNETTQAFEYDITAAGDTYFTFGDAEFTNWDDWNANHRYAIAAGDKEAVTGTEYQLVKIEGEGTVKINATGTLHVSVTKDLKMTLSLSTITDGIASIKAAQENGAAIYTLQGVRVNNVKKGGMYIINGRKVAIK